MRPQRARPATEPPPSRRGIRAYRDAFQRLRPGWRLLSVGASVASVVRDALAASATVLRVANVFDPEWDAQQDRAPFTWRRARLGRQAGSEKLGVSAFELPPGASSFPLHVHHANEELIVVLAGHPTLRTLEGERALEPGEVVACPTGRRGAHRLDNRSDQPVRVLIVSTMLAPELNEYPDSGKLWARTYPPGGAPAEESVELIARPEDGVDYLDGEV